MRRGLVWLLFLSLIMSACGGKSDADELADALGESLWEEARPDVEAGAVPFDFNEADADCLAEVIVDAVGYETLTEAGVTADSVREGLEDEAPDFFADNPEAADAFIDGMNRCIDMASAIADQFAADLGVSEESAQCMGEGLMNQQAFRDSMIDSMIGSGVGDPLESDPDSIGALFGLMNECLTDEELAAIMGS